jgi:pimeloyl-ACP methyl ester carboxylesterase
MSEPFQFVANGEINLRVRVEGTGPLVVLVHGWPESWYSYRHQIGPLCAAGFRVAALDVRGYGGSDKPHAIEAYGLRALCGDVAAVIDACGAGEPAVLIGHDWGAPIVWASAIVHRAKVRAVAGMSVPHLGHPNQPVIETFRKLYVDRFFYQIYFQEPGLAERELEADIELSLRKIYYGASGAALSEERAFLSQKSKDAAFLEGMIDPDPLPSWLSQADLAYYAEQFRAGGFRGPLNRYRNYEHDFRDLPELGQKISQPALFIAGERDPVLRFVPGRSLISVIDGFYADLRGKFLIAGAGHWVQQEAPQAVNAHLLKFLAEL